MKRKKPAYICPDHKGIIPPTKGWFFVEFWSSGDISVSGCDPFHPYCPPYPYASRESAEFRRKNQKPTCMAGGNDSIEAWSREKQDRAIGHDVWSYDWLRNVLKEPGLKERMIYLLPSDLAKDAKELFDASLERRSRL